MSDVSLQQPADTDCHDSVIWSVAQRGTTAGRLYIDRRPLTSV
jgi:hypothetical protein